MRKTFIFLIISLYTCILTAKPFYLIVHGTWCRPFSWHMPGGDFYDALVQATDPLSVSFFIWSGNNNHQDRLIAAQQLVDHLAICMPLDAELTIIAHSHGANVAILASHIIEQQKKPYIIHNFYALGTPISTVSYLPNMHIIRYFYNMFSFSDMVQPVFGMFKRELPHHDRMSNICITINGKEPSHSELHSPIVAAWLPYIPHTLHKFTYEKPGIIHFYTDKPPIYEIDELRSMRQQRDMFMLLSLKRKMVQQEEIRRSLVLYGEY